MSVLAFTLTACGGLPGEVKGGVESRIPGAKILSFQKGKIPSGDQDTLDNAWCVVAEKGSDRYNVLVTEGKAGDTGFMSYFPEVEEDMFKKYDCTNWTD